MKEIKNNVLNESYFEIDHQLGLKIFIYPKHNVHSAYAIFGTNYGSTKTKFKMNGKLIEVPDGTAHFLEHKMFDSEKGDTFAEYAKTGASANAFTSFNQTCYLFSSTGKFYESLKILLNFVQDPYFTDESVEKEQGIIGQEIKMYDDNPSWKVMFNLLESMYHNHAVKIDIAGTVESIAKITKETLYDCYNSYYNLHNMVLVICGDVSIEETIKVINEELKSSEKIEVEDICNEEPLEVVKERCVAHFPINIPIFQLGFKEKTTKKRANAEELALTDIILEVITGKSFELYEDLISNSLINDKSFSAEYFEGLGYRAVIFSGESKDPDKVAQKINEYIYKIKKEGISKENFELAKKIIYGRSVAMLNNNEIIGNFLVSSYFSGFNIYDYIDNIKNANLAQVNTRLNDQLDPEYSSISIIMPK